MIIYLVYAYRVLFYLFIQLLQRTGFLKLNEGTLSELDEFIAKRKKKFLAFCEHRHVDEYAKKNKSILPVLYNRKEMSEILKDENNEIEKIWKARVLIDHTPRGNIIMFYDVYKHAFSYYCDWSVVPHMLLNAVAMKYVQTFFCLDFFVDELVLKDNSSPFIKLMKEEEKGENEKKRDVFKNLADSTHIDTKNLPFIRPKPVAMETTPTAAAIKAQKYGPQTPVITGVASAAVAPGLLQSEKITGKMGEKAPEKTINKFIYLGKVQNFGVIQRPAKKGKEIMFKKINYSEYRNLFMRNNHKE